MRRDISKHNSLRHDGRVIVRLPFNVDCSLLSISLMQEFQDQPKLVEALFCIHSTSFRI